MDPAPALDELVGARVHVKHENHQPVGAFKVRGGVNLVAGYRAKTCNIIESSGAAPLAAALKLREELRGRCVALVASGGNVTREQLLEVLA